jgi:hypothetical protein
VQGAQQRHHHQHRTPAPVQFRSADFGRQFLFRWPQDRCEHRDRRTRHRSRMVQPGTGLSGWHAH